MFKLKGFNDEMSEQMELLKREKKTLEGWQLNLNSLYIDRTVNSLLSGHIGNWTKCPFVELSAYENYSHNVTLQIHVVLLFMLNERTACLPRRNGDI